MFFRSSRPKDFCKKAALRDFAKFTGKHLCQSLLIHKVVGQGRQHYLKRDPGTDVSYEFCEIWKNSFFTEHLSWLLLVLQNRCSYKFSNIHQKISVLKSFLDSQRPEKPATLIKKRPPHKCFPVNITKFLRIAVLWNTSGGCFCIQLKNFKEFLIQARYLYKRIYKREICTLQPFQN